MKDRRDEEHDQHGNNSGSSATQLVYVFIHVGVKPIMDHDVPCAIIGRISRRVPPILQLKQSILIIKI